MVLTRARAKALAVESKWQCITVTEEPEDSGIPDLVRRRRCGPGVVDSMAAKNQAKLAEKLMKKQALEAKRKDEEEVSAVEGGQGVERKKAKRQRMVMSVPPPSSVVPPVVQQPAGIFSKGSSSSLPPPGDKGKAATAEPRPLVHDNEEGEEEEDGKGVSDDVQQVSAEGVLSSEAKGGGD
ncbi:hypothetical protein SESBI_38284 [Sesbania bispinosa]|nr:hypothetical protein SESBI_38284 [Sesbania bispinosa]